MADEISAGAVICRKIGSNWNVLLIRDMNGNLTFPKGFIEKGESAQVAAIREAKEETGISHLTYITDLPDVSYMYTREKRTIHKLVHYLLFVCDRDMPLSPQIEEGISEIIWMPIEQAHTMIGYPGSNVSVLEHAYKIIHSKSL